MDIWDFIPWIVCALIIGALAWAIIREIRKGPEGVKYVVFCCFVFVGLFIFVCAAQGFGDMASNLMAQLNVHLSEKLADSIGYVIVGAWSIGLYLFIKHNSK